MIACTECASPLSLPADTVEGEVLACASCETELEVVGVSPLTVAPAPEVDEDWGE